MSDQIAMAAVKVKAEALTGIVIYCIPALVAVILLVMIGLTVKRNSKDTIIPIVAVTMIDLIIAFATLSQLPRAVGCFSAPAYCAEQEMKGK